MRTRILASLCFSLVMLGQGVANAGLMLPGEPLLSRQFGDFQSYSLPFLNNFFGSGFQVPSSPGQISDGVVIATGAEGNNVRRNFAGMNNSYETPSGVSGSSFFETAANHPTSFFGAPAFDPSNTWNTNVSSLASFLQDGGGQLAFFFNLNETGNADTLAGLDLLVWAEVRLHDLAGNVVERFILSAPDDPLTPADDELALGLAASAGGGPVVDPVVTTDPRWGRVHGSITVDEDGNFVRFGGGSLVTDPPGSKTIDQNLGANQAAFAIFNAELDNLVRNNSAAYSILSIDLRLTELNNGFEQLFILNDTNVGGGGGIIPEPASLLIWSGFGIAAFAGRFRRVPKKA